jgi:hypothetical protein
VSSEEESVLAPWEWNHNEAFLHWDERVSFPSLLCDKRANSVVDASQKKGIFR